MSALVLFVRLYDGCYNGHGDWPPSPARLFQALVAGAGLSGPIADTEKKALEWLEKQGAPLVAAPLYVQPKRGVRFYMPNNDTDAIGGDPLGMAKIRTATKVFRPYFFDATVPFLYAWELAGQPEDEEQAKQICIIAERLYQLGRGTDMAWAWGDVIEDAVWEEILREYRGHLFRPSRGRSKTSFLCPCSGSLDMLLHRHQAFAERFRYERKGKALRVVYRKPPKPLFERVPYNSSPSYQLYEIRSPTEEGAFAPWPLARAAALVVQLRDAAVLRMKSALPEQTANIECALVGRKPDGTNEISPVSRVRIIPLPSIGHPYADLQIRRVLVEVPPSCPLHAPDVQWAFSGLDIVDLVTGEVRGTLVCTDDDSFLRYYGVESHTPHRVWRTVTAAVLPEDARRRRIDPERKVFEAKTGFERAAEETRAARAVCQALRHLGVRERAEAVRVQREPFQENGDRAEAFAEGSRFSKHRLWHLEIALEEPIYGPLVIGDGRFLGLGVMAPIPQRPLTLDR
ncbi:MAG TPA: type I-U CRISPR-associated protein Csb2 [Gemmatimonadaceae bacterium]|nr:type I-U CRISPR-associated protein Csb2 [Gemmatimonadaceae bacterium]